MGRSRRFQKGVRGRENGHVALNVLTRSIAGRAFDRMTVPQVPAEPSWVRDVVEQADSRWLSAGSRMASPQMMTAIGAMSACCSVARTP